MASAVMNPVGEEKMEEQPQETLASLNQPKTDEEKEIFDQCLEYLENMLQYDVQKYVPGEDHYFRNRAAYAVYGKNYTKSPAKFICFTLPNCKNGSERYVSVAKHDHAIVLGSLCRSKGDAKYTAIESFLRFNGYADALEERKIKETILAGGTPAKRAHDEGIEQPAAKKSDVNPVEFDSNEQLSAGTQHYLITKPKNPSCLVNEFLASNGHKAAQYNVELVEGGFKAECTAKDYSVFGVVARSKQLAKHSAARKMLDHLIRNQEIPTPKELPFYHDQLTQPKTFEQFVRYACFEALAGAMEKNKLALLSDTHLAGCVMVDGAKREAQLISMCTGSYAGPQIYNNGEDVRDCDALVLCKRGLQKFLMKEVCVFYTKESASIFYQQQESGKLALRLNISFHMYTNYNPLPSEQSISLRTKRTVGANKFAPRKFVPLSMVTADKMLKWNVMGVQGAILSQSMDPVFISSFIINARADHDELYKMICGRYPSKNVEDRRIICPKIVVMQPQAPYTLDIEPYSPGERYAVMWNITNPEDIELVSCTSGYCWDGTPSKISDIGLLEEIKNIYTIMGIDIGNPTYNDVKYTLNTKNYFSAMDRVKQAFRSSQMGNWVEKTRRIVEN